MDNSCMPPLPPSPSPPKKMTLTKAEIVEKVLLNLPVKSLLRFSSVSKSWNSTIFGSDFRKRYRRRAALPGRERIVTTVSVPGVHINTITGNPSTCLLSSISSSSNIVDATAFESPFGNNDPHQVLASCHDLWLARSYSAGLYGAPLILWNPSMRSFKHVPNSTLARAEFDVFLGLGYECAGDDYKILRISFNLTTREMRAKLYSMRFDCWRNIEDFPTSISSIDHGGCTLVSGKLHFMPGYRPAAQVIICFDLLTERFGEVAQPNYSLESLNTKNVTVLKEMLCLSIDYDKCCDVWMMEEYGVVGSWTKKFSIAYFNDSINGNFIMPLYLYDSGEILVRYFDGLKTGMFVYNEEDDGSRAREVFVDDNKTGRRDFVYVDSLVAPAMWVDTKKELSSNEHDHAQTFQLYYVTSDT